MRDAWLEVSTNGWFEVSLFEGREYRFREYTEDIEEARGWIKAWLDSQT